MAKVQVIVELKYNTDLAETAFAAAPATEKELDPGTVPKMAGVKFDTSFAPTSVPGMVARTAADVPYVSGEKFDLALEPKDSTYIARAEIDEGKFEDLSRRKSVVGVYSDVEIQPTIICPGDPALGTDEAVERLLCVPRLHKVRMNGRGVLVAIVDTGINAAYLATQGKTITVDVGRSWVPTAGMVPGNAPVGHGTMCAFDAAIAAPAATFLDVQLLRSSATGPTAMSGVLSDAVLAYRHLIEVMTAPRRPGDSRSMVVNNSWGMFHPSWDFPPGHPGNYSDNPNHPFNRIVGALERVGADILFAAGNCGSDCADGRCRGVTTNAIYGANGHSSVLTIAGVDVRKNRVGYSTQGPGRLSRNKPDLCGYTHFDGSGVYTADGGTSAATPVVAGVVAAVRNRRPYQPGNPAVSPAAIRALMRSTAEDLGTTGFDFDHGFGVVDGCELYRRLGKKLEPFNICRRFPWLCRPPIDICRRYPRLCGEIPSMGPGSHEGLVTGASDASNAAMLDGDELGDLLQTIWDAGYHDGQEAAAGGAHRAASGGCGCEGSETSE